MLQVRSFLHSGQLKQLRTLRVPFTLLLLAALFFASPLAGSWGQISIAVGNCLIGLSLWVTSRKLGAFVLLASLAGMAWGLTEVVGLNDPGTFSIGSAVCAAAFALAVRNAPLVNYRRVKLWLARIAVYAPMTMIAAYTFEALRGLQPTGMSIGAGSATVALALACKSARTRALAMLVPLGLIARVVPLALHGPNAGVYAIAIAACSVGAVIAFNAGFTAPAPSFLGRWPRFMQPAIALVNPMARSSAPFYKALFSVLSPAVLIFCLWPMAQAKSAVFEAVAASGGIVACGIIALRYSQRNRDLMLLALLGGMVASIVFSFQQHDANVAYNLIEAGAVGISVMASQGRSGDTRGIIGLLARNFLRALPWLLALALVFVSVTFALTVTKIIAMTIPALIVMHLPISFTNVLLGLRADGGGASPWGQRDDEELDGRWTAEQSKQWFTKQPWLVGGNFTPANAVNQLEMWQADTFDAERIELELSWAESLGMNTMRVFLHDLLWEQDTAGFTARIDQFLTICARHGIRPMLVLFDSCWSPFPQLGVQKAPVAGVHNSGWVQGPGAEALKDRKQHTRLQAYVEGVVGAFANDERVLCWDVWNEPNNGNDASYGPLEPQNKQELVAALLPQVFAWARSAKPSQPLTSGLWDGNWWVGLTQIQRTQLRHSDVISFHNYGAADDFTRRAEWLAQFDRALLCTEFMARGTGSELATILPIAKERHIGMFTWGLVAGKTQTYVPWDSWGSPYQGQPPLWFHDLLRQDGTAYRNEEVAFLRAITAGKEVR